jgi:hypothetical protein
MNSGIAYGGYFVSNQDSDETVGIAAESTTDAGVFDNTTNNSELDIASGSDLLSGSGSSGGATFSVDQSANIYSSGKVTAEGFETSGDAMYREAGASGSTLIAYGMRSAAPEIEDVGEAQLVNGRAIVHIDAKLADVMDRHSAYHVFLTPEGDGNALYVAQKTPISFVVAEQRGGRSTMAFDYRIIAQPYAHTAERLAIAAPLRRPPTPFAKRHARVMRSPSFITPPDLALRASVGPQRYQRLIAAKRKELAAR